MSTCHLKFISRFIQGFIDIHLVTLVILFLLLSHPSPNLPNQAHPPVGSLHTSTSMMVQCDHFPLRPSTSSSITQASSCSLLVGCASEPGYEAQWFVCDVEHSWAVCTVTSNWLEGMCMTAECLVFDSNWELLRGFSESCALR